jgi:hypothetical protein
MTASKAACKVSSFAMREVYLGRNMLYNPTKRASAHDMLVYKFIQHPNLLEFFKKRVKKLNSKRCRFGNFRKMGASRPINGREAWGRRPPAHPTGGRFQNFSQSSPESLFANKKLFLFVKRPLRHPTSPTDGRFPFFLILYSNLYFTNYLKFILFQIQDLFAILFCIHIKF